jgi:thiamine-phosphate pyrophosphorylase
MRLTFREALAGTHIYPITDRKLSGLTHAEQVELASAGGAKLIQLREKDLSPSEFYREATDAIAKARSCGMKLIINDRVDVALAAKADGVHLGQDDLPPDAARQILGPEIIIGLSTHTPEQARLAAKLPVDYIAIGPVFSTTTKLGAEATIGAEGVRLARQEIGEIPLVAIGGITCDNYEGVLQAGADAVSVIKDLWADSRRAPDQIRFFLRSQ